MSTVCFVFFSKKRYVKDESIQVSNTSGEIGSFLQHFCFEGKTFLQSSHVTKGSRVAKILCLERTQSSFKSRIHCFKNSVSLLLEEIHFTFSIFSRTFFFKSGEVISKKNAVLNVCFISEEQRQQQGTSISL